MNLWEDIRGARAPFWQPLQAPLKDYRRAGTCMYPEFGLLGALNLAKATLFLTFTYATANTKYTLTK